MSKILIMLGVVLVVLGVIWTVFPGAFSWLISALVNYLAIFAMNLGTHVSIFPLLL